MIHPTRAKHIRHEEQRAHPLGVFIHPARVDDRARVSAGPAIAPGFDSVGDEHDVVFPSAPAPAQGVGKTRTHRRGPAQRRPVVLDHPRVVSVVAVRKADEPNVDGRILRERGARAEAITKRRREEHDPPPQGTRGFPIRPRQPPHLAARALDRSNPALIKDPNRRVQIGLPRRRARPGSVEHQPALPLAAQPVDNPDRPARDAPHRQPARKNDEKPRPVHFLVVGRPNTRA